ncbi:MAG: butyrate kinase [Bacteroidales bacterium]|nr:butyrate kinase [Bacteroidales bacterium]
MIIQRILAINPGSTSTKIAVYRNTKPRFLKSIRHSPKDLSKFKNVIDQFSFRKELILKELAKEDMKMNEITAVIGRGGIMRPLLSGVYEVNEAMREDLSTMRYGEHASSLGGLIADDIASTIPGARAFIANPTTVDEFHDVARISGHPLFKRVSIFHALNHKMIAENHARLVGKKYEELNLIVAHMGGGISVGAHQKGRVIDANQALDGGGPFGPERSGTLPMGDFARLCFSGEYSLDEVKKMIIGQGGYVAYFNTNDAYTVGLMAEQGNEKAKLIQNAMAYQVAKEIGALSAVLKGQVDAILLTGGIAHNTVVVDYIKAMVAHMARVVVYPGEDEMKALAENALKVMLGEEECKIY